MIFQQIRRGSFCIVLRKMDCRANILFFCRANILFFCHAQNIYNHRLCWPPDDIVENSFLSYNSKNKLRTRKCLQCTQTCFVCQNMSKRVCANMLPSYNLYEQQSRWSFNKYVAVVSASFCANYRDKNILFFCHAQNIYNHRLCWPPDVFVAKPFISYNYKNK